MVQLKGELWCLWKNKVKWSKNVDFTNLFSIKIPCHRVIRSDGSLGGYSGRGGIKKKLKLLRSEKVAI